MLARNSLLARLADSAASLAFSNSASACLRAVISTPWPTMLQTAPCGSRSGPNVKSMIIRLVALIENLGFETHHFALRPRASSCASPGSARPGLYLQPSVSQNGLPSTSSSLESGGFNGGAVAFDQLAVQREEADKSEQRVDDIAQPFFAGGQLGCRLQTLRHVADGADNANGRALIVADDAAARNHPAIRAVAMLEPQLVGESVLGEVLVVAVLVSAIRALSSG